MSEQALTRRFSLSGMDFTTGPISVLALTLLRWLDECRNPSDQYVLTGNKLVTYINPHVYNLSMNDDVVRCCLERADRVCIDGIGIKLALLLMQRRVAPRVVAEHLFNQLVEELEKPTEALLVGASQQEASAAANALMQRNSNLDFAATLDGYAPLDVCRQFFKEHSEIPLVLIGAGTPKSEQIALIAMQECCCSVIVHIGAGTIKTWAGSKRRGPALMSASGLEWIHRIVFEPHTRSRYTLGALVFARNLFSRRSRHAATDRIRRDQL